LNNLHFEDTIVQNFFVGERDVYARARGVYLACIEAVYFDVVGDVRGLPAKQRVRRHVGRKLVTRVCILVQSLGERVQR